VQRFFVRKARREFRDSSFTTPGEHLAVRRAGLDVHGLTPQARRCRAQRR
jgi:hypothetical protein